MGNPLILPAPGYDWDHDTEARRNFAVKKAVDSKLERADVEAVLSSMLGRAPEFADDTAAAAGGVLVGGLYRTGSVLKVRVA